MQFTWLIKFLNHGCKSTLHESNPGLLRHKIINYSPVSENPLISRNIKIDGENKAKYTKHTYMHIYAEKANNRK